MIKLLKNKEVRKALLWQLLLSAAACAVCFSFDIRAGLTAAGLSLLLMLVFCISTYKRYQRISSLADDINQVLHGDHAIDFDSYSEGERSTLHREIYKMTICLREQQRMQCVGHYEDSKRWNVGGTFHLPICAKNAEGYFL